MASTAAHSARFSSTCRDRASFYQDITTKIIAELEAGRAPWVQPWNSSKIEAPVGMPVNAATGRAYSGINVLILWAAVLEHGFSRQSWLTFRQALQLGGCVRKGERGTTIVYADRFAPKEDRARANEAEEVRTIPFLKRYTVFNVEQCEGLPREVAPQAEPVHPEVILPQVEALIRATRADVRIGGDRAYYSVLGDYIRVPAPHAFFEPINWHRTLLHELSHWTGAAHRQHRDLSGAFGSKAYAFEELIAEISAAYVCAALGITPTVRHADYIGSWLDLLREDNRTMVRAAASASKGADFLLALLPQRVWS